MKNFKNELLKNCEKGVQVDFFSETIGLNELIDFQDKQKEMIEIEAFDFEVDTSEFFEQTFEDEVFGLVYLKYKTVELFGYKITMHLLNEEFFGSDSTIIYQVEKGENKND